MVYFIVKSFGKRDNVACQIVSIYLQRRCYNIMLVDGITVCYLKPLPKPKIIILEIMILVKLNLLWLKTKIIEL